MSTLKNLTDTFQAERDELGTRWAAKLLGQRSRIWLRRGFLPRPLSPSRNLLRTIHHREDGTIKDVEVAHNFLADEGEEDMLDVYFRGATAPTEFYLRLYNEADTTNGTIDETINLSDASSGEPSSNGYSAQLVERNTTGWPTLTQTSGDFQVQSKEVTFSASGGSWGPVDYAIVATTSDDTGLALAAVALSESRTLKDGETLRSSYDLTLS